MSPCEKSLHTKCNDRMTKVFLSRHGESLNNVHGRIGGNSSLSNRGESYARALGCFINSMNLPDLKVVVRIVFMLDQSKSVTGLVYTVQTNTTNCRIY